MRNLFIKCAYRLGIYLLLPILLLQCVDEKLPPESPESQEVKLSRLKEKRAELIKTLKSHVDENTIRRIRSHGFNTLAITLSKLRDGLDYNLSESEKQTAFGEAVEYGDEQIIGYFLQGKIGTVKAKKANGQTRLHIVAKENNYDNAPSIIKFLLDHKENIDAVDNEGKTPLRWAAREGHVDIVKCLIDNGANIFLKDNQDRSPFAGAYTYRHVEVIQVILESIQQKSPQSLQSHATNLFSWCINDLIDNSLETDQIAKEVKLFEIACEYGANINVTDTTGRTALHRACVSKNTAIANLLIEKKADLNIKDHEKNRPIDYALMSENLEILRKIDDQGSRQLIDWNTLDLIKEKSKTNHEIDDLLHLVVCGVGYKLSNSMVYHHECPAVKMFPEGYME